MLISIISSMLQTSLCFIGTILVFISIYLIVNEFNNSNLFKSTRSRFMNRMYHSQSPFAVVVNMLSRSALSSVDVVTNKLNLHKPIDTQVCLSPPISSELVAGLTNTGNSCFLNSVLQALSSLPQLQHYLDQSSKISPIKNLPVTRSLLKTLRLLSSPMDRIFKPIDIVNALKHRKQVINRQQQDAQELYQLLISQLDDEIDKTKQHESLENPLNGTLTYKIICTECGYSSGTPNQKFNNIQLTLPDTETTTLDQCLAQFTNMEYLTEVECVKCSLKKTINALRKKGKSSLLQELEYQLKRENLEEGWDAIQAKVQKSNGVKTKQALFSKPPPILCLHFVRSLFLPTGDMVKNTCQVEFPSVLDLSPYCTPHQAATYKLMSTVVHYGDHYSGHYIAYKRKISAEKCSCDQCGQDDMLLKLHENEWFKISDDRVMPCETSDALRENPFMLMYELIQPTVIEEEEEEEEATIEELLSSSVPAAPPSSPVLIPITYKRKNLSRPIPNIYNHHSIPILTQ